MPRFSQETPFELEITNDRHYVLPLKLAVPKKELFVCIDDDLTRDGHSLVKRGFYPIEPELKIAVDEIIEQNNDYTIKKMFLAANGEIRERYYEDEIRSENLMKKTVFVINGRLLIRVNGKELILTAGQTATVYSNILHSIKALEDSVFMSIFSSTHNKKIKYAESN